MFVDIFVSIDDIESGSLLFAALYIKCLVDFYIDHPILIVLTYELPSDPVLRMRFLLVKIVAVFLRRAGILLQREI